MIGCIGLAGLLLGVSVATPDGGIGEPITAERGIASYVAPRYGARYLALPDGPGHRVEVCGPAACVTRTSTDAGPDLAMQRAGRIADLSYADFVRVCGCRPELRGLVRVTVTYLGAQRTLPPTDATPTPT